MSREDLQIEFFIHKSSGLLPFPSDIQGDITSKVEISDFFGEFCSLKVFFL